MLDAQQQRVAVIKKVHPAVVAVLNADGTNGGSGVIIDPEGYALTNYHVVAADRHRSMQCGLADGVLYDAVLVGLDKVGDVALIKLLPKEKGKPFPFVPLGDSDKVKAGDWSLAMGNPFLLATDFTPTVTYGLVSGVNRYQPPEGGRHPGVHRLHPDRHVDQPRQLRRAAVQHAGRADRHQRPRVVREARPGELRRRLRDLDQPDQELPGPPAGRHRHRPRHPRRHRRHARARTARSRRCWSSRSWRRATRSAAG